MLDVILRLNVCSRSALIKVYVWYRMDVEKGKIEDTGGSGGSYSIKTQFNSEEQWTKALKFMLTNLKWGLAWVSSQFYNK